jgi:hypothetical protein
MMRIAQGGLSRRCELRPPLQVRRKLRGTARIDQVGAPYVSCRLAHEELDSWYLGASVGGVRGYLPDRTTHVVITRLSPAR